MRKKSKPNPNQRHFELHVQLMGVLENGHSVCLAKYVPTLWLNPLVQLLSSLRAL
jgi:hypothetical protein